MSTKTGKTVGILARFDNPGELLHAAEKVRAAGYRRFDCHSPFPIHGMDRAMGLPPSKLGWLVAFCGLCGCSFGLLMQWWVNVEAYSLNISNKPIFALPAFIPVTFELTILFSAFGAVFGMLAFNLMPRAHHPVFYSDNFHAALDDGFFVSIEAEDPLFDARHTQAFLQDIHAHNIELLVEND
jgi:hypothetical protein